MNDLYQENILDHAGNPHNYHELLCDNCINAKGDNPSCGDSATIFLKIENLSDSDVNAEKSISQASFTGTGCAISQASLSMLTDNLIGKSLDFAKKLMPGDIYKMLGINITPARVNCALLSYRALEQVLIKYDTEIVNKNNIEFQ